jgi:hypothetical protein
MSKRVTKALRTVACFLGVHKVKVLGTDGTSRVGRCLWCKKYVLQDSHGHWFAIEGKAYVLKGKDAERAIKNKEQKDGTEETAG